MAVCFCITRAAQAGGSLIEQDYLVYGQAGRLVRAAPSNNIVEFSCMAARCSPFIIQKVVIVPKAIH
jgi:hypothetical protein